jgi:hypothetical protein
MEILEKLEVNNIRGFEPLDIFLKENPDYQNKSKSRLFQEYINF